ncbi:MAG: trigger factor [Bacteroidales bacterium]|jgi:trigger factor|nr:trigger factor [Bacteroidales bacterium]
MNINKNQVDDLNLTVSLEINNDDYASKVNDVLRDYRRKANMPGFRPGKVPEGLIRKMYGKPVLVDEINKLVSESLQKFIDDENLHVLGDPMPVTNGEELDWEIGNSFKFDFEMGLAPVIDQQPSKEDKITKYEITIEKDLIDKNIENYASRFGQFVETDAIKDMKEKLTGNIVQLDENQQPLEEGLSAEDTSVMVSLIKDKEHQKPFKKAKVGDEIVFNLSDTFPNDWEIASILRKKDKEEVGDIKDAMFRFSVSKIEKFENAALDQELFDKIFGEGVVKSAEELEEKIKEDIGKDFEEATMAKFGADAHTYFLEKINPALPEEFLRKWLWNANKEKIDEASFNEQFPSFLKSMQWSVISEAIIKQNEIKVEEQEIIDFAKESTRRQFAQYGITSFPDDALTSYAMNSLKEESNVRQVISQIMDKKVSDAIYQLVDVSVQEISLDDFNKMMTPEPVKEENKEENNNTEES